MYVCVYMHVCVCIYVCVCVCVCVYVFELFTDIKQQPNQRHSSEQVSSRKKIRIYNWEEIHGKYMSDSNIVGFFLTRVKITSVPCGDKLWNCIYSINIFKHINIIKNYETQNVLKEQKLCGYIHPDITEFLKI